MLLLPCICLLLAHVAQAKHPQKKVDLTASIELSLLGDEPVFVAPYKFKGRTGMCEIDTGSPDSEFRANIFKGVKAFKGPFLPPLNFNIGHMQYVNTSFPPASKTTLSELNDRDADALIGLDFLRYTSLAWRGQGPLLEVEGPTAATIGDLLLEAAPSGEKTYEIIPIDVTDNDAFGPATINGTPGYFMLDTGSWGVDLHPDFAAKSSVKIGDDIVVSLLYGDGKGKEASNVNLSLGTQPVPIKESEVVTKSWLLDEWNDDDVDGLIGCDFLYRLRGCVFDLKNLAIVAPHPDIPAPAKSMARYPGLPTSGGVCLITSGSPGYLTAFCEDTKDVFEIPVAARIPSFRSIHLAVYEAKQSPQSVQAITLAPSQHCPDGWFEIRRPGLLPVAFPPGVKVCMRHGWEVVRAPRFKTEPGPANASVFTSVLSAGFTFGPPPARMIAISPEGRTMKMESDVPIEIPSGWNFACPLNWKVTSGKNGQVLAIPPDANMSKSAEIPETSSGLTHYHWRHYVTAGWTLVPD